MSRFLLVFCWFLGCVLQAGGAEFPSRPESHIQDDSGLLSEKQRLELSVHWNQLEQAGRGDYYLVTMPYLPAPFTELFNHLRDQWPKHSLGGVFFYSRGDKRWYFIAGRQLVQEMNPQELTVANEALAKLKMDSLTGSDELVTTLRTVTNSIGEKLEAMNEGNRPYKLPNFLLAGGLLLLGLVLHVFLAARLKRLALRRRQLTTCHYFPSVRVGYRLGGPFSGGTVFETKFEVEKKQS